MTNLSLPFEDTKLWDYLRWNSYLSERYKLFYVATPKVACTSLKWWFADLEGYSRTLSEVTDSAESDPDLVIHDSFYRVAPSVTGLRPEALAESIMSDSYFRFAVVRNPYKRIFSAWQSKLLLREPLQVEPYLEYDFIWMPIESAADIAFAFEAFLEHLVSHETPNYWDLHWSPQVVLLRPDVISYTKIAQIEKVEELKSALVERLGSHIADPFANHRTNESLIPYSPDFITERAAELIRLLYVEDFEIFGYNNQLPTAKEVFSSFQLNVAIQAIRLIRGRHQRLAQIRSALSGQIASLNKTVAEQEVESCRLNSVILEKDKAIFVQKDEIQRLENVVEQKDNAIVGQADEINRLENVVEQKDNAIVGQADEINRLKNVGEQKDCKLLSINQELERIQSSRLFRFFRLVRPERWRQRGRGRFLHHFLDFVAPSKIKYKAASILIHLGLKRDGAESSPSSSGLTAYQIRIPVKVSNNRPKVVHIIANFMTGGSSRLVVDLIELLGDRYDQSVITSFIPAPPEYIGLDITEYRNSEDLRIFIEHFARIKPTLIHLHYWGDCDEPWYAKLIQAAETLEIPILENINTPILPYVSSAIRRYVYVSNYVRKVYGQPNPNHITIYPGSDFSLFNRLEDETCPNDCIGMVYRLERDKLNEVSIKPFIRAVQKRPSTKVLIVGGGSLLELFKKAVQTAGVADHFEFTGYVSYTDLPNLYRRMALFVTPVWKESFGQVSAFAMNMRIPVVGYDVGAIGEITDNESLLAPAGDEEKLSDIIVRLLDAPEERAEIGEFLQKKARDHFSVQAMGRAYANLYAEMIKETISR